MGKDAADQLFDVIERDGPEAAQAGEAAAHPGGEAGGDDADKRDVDIVLRVHVQPGAGRSAVMGRFGDALKVKVAASPEGGRANVAVAELLATTLGVPASGVTLVSGEGSRSKRFRIGPVPLEAARRLILAAEAGASAAAGGRGNARGGGGVR
ncbi:MAG: DUF167 domain-containing protein [Acidimicrobiales bacterium]